MPSLTYSLPFVFAASFEDPKPSRSPPGLEGFLKGGRLPRSVVEGRAGGSCPRNTHPSHESLPYISKMKPRNIVVSLFKNITPSSCRI